jgi:hypothetical protein
MHTGPRRGRRGSRWGTAAFGLRLAVVHLIWGAAQSLDGGADVTHPRRRLLAGHPSTPLGDECLIPGLVEDLWLRQLDIRGFHPTAAEEIFPCALRPSFQPTITEYTCSLPVEQASVIVTPYAANGDRNNQSLLVKSRFLRHTTCSATPQQPASLKNASLLLTSRSACGGRHADAHRGQLVVQYSSCCSLTVPPATAVAVGTATCVHTTPSAEHAAALGGRALRAIPVRRGVRTTPDMHTWRAYGMLCCARRC